MTVKNFSYAKFNNDTQFPEGFIFEGSGGYRIDADCTGGGMEFSIGFPNQDEDIALFKIPFVLFGSGPRAEGLRGTINQTDLDDGDGSGTIGNIDAIRQTLQTSAVESAEALVTLEEPVDQSVASGVSNIRGWAVAPSGISKLELFINGNYISDMPYGGDRGDVGAAFPDIVNAKQSGFGQTYNYGLLGSGQHTMTVRAYANDGGYSEETSTFNVAAFEDSFIKEEGFPSLRDASVSLNRETGEILVQNVLLADNSTYDLALQWRKATQGFGIVEVLEFVVD
ncbi:MAG: Ig-like domain-containing protein [Luminiphilus sp.]|nr:Ig-like domain-containing protein [Luminiphilus sp.]